ncbi:uncharacterized protein B0I36DRAFT_79828 [Microdochium trichocladiopsis]|uniref:Uncharacterized protein n=1 Tax=Microdochium trichocladiopsis TaxID=1682393 RepID=A0A9P8XS36_9PEZI|nr:uncharacterized protein B0I36DRAFT_79828 [Microdochium trichocladiopsis]KAH7009091.1 hypothetical protein B0I36DRAFT_79828 [Microdochium trichocladiopsis]
MKGCPKYHTRWQKEKHRKNVQSAKAKAEKLGRACNTFVLYVTFNLVSRQMEGVCHLPPGMQFPDINKFVREQLLPGNTGESQDPDFTHVQMEQEDHRDLGSSQQPEATRSSCSSPSLDLKELFDSDPDGDFGAILANKRG